MSSTNRITDIIDQVSDEIEGSDIQVGEIVKQFENRGFGPILMIPALIAMLPTGAIPGIPSACGITIFLVSIQMIIGLDHPWIPNKLSEMSVDKDRYKKVEEKVKPITEKIDQYIHPRLEFLTKDPASRIIALICALLGLSMVPLELLPFAAALPALAIVLAATALITKDGFVMIAAAALCSGVIYILYSNFV